MAIGARKQPLYDQLVDILTEKIDHEYRAGDMIPSERELSERYGLSRTTVRLALQELERLGLVVRQHGRGTFVTDRSAKATNLMQSYSFTEQMRAMGREPETTILEFCEMEADKNLAEHMGLHPKYVSAILNGHREPADAEQKFRSALDELVALKSSVHPE